jgi:hypothetical protein
MEGFEVPLAAWRVHASAAELETRVGNQHAADVTAPSPARRFSPWRILSWTTNVSASHSSGPRRCARSSMPGEGQLMKTTAEQNKPLVLEAFNS